MTCVALIAVLTLAPRALPMQSRSPTLSELVAKLGTDSAGLPPDLVGMHITSSATLAHDGELAFAGYKDDGTHLLNPPLYVGLRQRGQSWRVAAITEPGRRGHFGSAMKISAAGSLLIVDMHLTPSAGEMIVLRRDLTYVTRLYGWFLTSLPAGLVVFHRSMIHFAPAHPGELATFDPRTGVEAQLYPTDRASPLRKSFIEQIRSGSFDVSFGQLQYDAKTDTLTFPVDFRGRHPTEIAPPQQLRLTVTCSPMRSRSRVCTELR